MFRAVLLSGALCVFGLLAANVSIVAASDVCADGEGSCVADAPRSGQQLIQRAKSAVDRQSRALLSASSLADSLTDSLTDSLANPPHVAAEGPESASVVNVEWLGDLEARFNLQGTEFLLELVPNSHLAQGLRHMLLQSDGSVHQGAEVEPCYFQGHVKGDPHSVVAVSACPSRQHPSSLLVDGWVVAHGFALLLEHVEPEVPALQGKPVSPTSVRSVKPEMQAKLNQIFAARRADSASSPGNTLAGTAVNATKYLELLFVQDYAAYQQWLTRGADWMLTSAVQVANMVGALFRTPPAGGALFPYNIRVNLVGVYTFTSLEPWDRSVARDASGNADPSSLLGAFTGWLNNQTGLPPRDAAQLQTARPLSGGVDGFAWVGTMCSSSATSIANFAVGRAFDQLAATSAHEVGHNFGMAHDGGNCNGYTIMVPVSNRVIDGITRLDVPGKAPTAFSGCSVANITSWFNKTYTRGPQCLENQPAPFTARTTTTTPKPLSLPLIVSARDQVRSSTVLGAYTYEQNAYLPQNISCPARWSAVGGGCNATGPLMYNGPGDNATGWKCIPAGTAQLLNVWAVCLPVPVTVVSVPGSANNAVCPTNQNLTSGGCFANAVMFSIPGGPRSWTCTARVAPVSKIFALCSALTTQFVVQQKVPAGTPPSCPTNKVLIGAGCQTRAGTATQSTIVPVTFSGPVNGSWACGSTTKGFSLVDYFLYCVDRAVLGNMTIPRA